MKLTTNLTGLFIVAALALTSASAGQSQLGPKPASVPCAQGGSCCYEFGAYCDQGGIWDYSYSIGGQCVLP